MLSHVMNIPFIALSSTHTALQLPQSPLLLCRRNISFPANSYLLKRRKFLNLLLAKKLNAFCPLYLVSDKQWQASVLGTLTERYILLFYVLSGMVFQEKIIKSCNYSRISTNGHLSTRANALQQLAFGGQSGYIDSCLNLSKTATFFCPQGGRCAQG